MSRNDYFDVRSAYLAHYGVKGMKWRFHKYLNQAGRRLQAYGTIAGVGLRRASKKVGAALNKARLALKTKYNPGAIGRRISRAYNISKLNERTKNHEYYMAKNNHMDSNGKYHRTNLANQAKSDYYNRQLKKASNPGGLSYVGRDPVTGKAYYGKKKKTGRSSSGKGGRW